MDIFIPVISLTLIGFLLAVMIVVVMKKLAIKEDERLGEIINLLAGANCGGCGRAGCADFARALIKGEAKITDCNPTSKEGKEAIGRLLGSDLMIGGDTLVINACGGGNACSDKYDYQGYGDCASIELLAGGRKSCPTGCIGAGTCTKVCAFSAVKLVNGVAVVDRTKCVKCGTCIKHCPKKIIRRIPGKAVYYIACSNPLKGKEVRINCRVGCISCEICMKSCPAGAITMVNNLPIINYDKCTACGICAEKCPSKCIKKVFNSK
jgi:Predicted NADH:ubiquinone oxidoreductase, subunit RnfB